jgi:hypothetical protein
MAELKKYKACCFIWVLVLVSIYDSRGNKIPTWISASSERHKRSSIVPWRIMQYDTAEVKGKDYGKELNRGPMRTRANPVATYSQPGWIARGAVLLQHTLSPNGRSKECRRHVSACITIITATFDGRTASRIE